jgi:peptidoglycan/LPS O-acetylase OafA/YrhL
MTARRRLPLILVAASTVLLAVALAATVAWPGRFSGTDAPGWPGTASFVLVVLSFALVAGSSRCGSRTTRSAGSWPRSGCCGRSSSRPPR